MNEPRSSAREAPVLSRAASLATTDEHQQRREHGDALDHARDHDGRLDAAAVPGSSVRWHYRHGVVASPNLAAQLRGNDDRPGLELDDDDSEAIIAFLHTLTDGCHG